METKDIRDYNVGNSNYSTLPVQPWDTWEKMHMNPWDADIEKRLLRTKKEPGKTWRESRIEDYEKIKHICDKRIDMLRNSRYDDRYEAIHAFVSRFGEDRLIELLRRETAQEQEQGQEQVQEQVQESCEIDVSPITSIEEGDRFLCIKDVIMNLTEEVAYRKGRIYTSLQDSCITDEQGSDCHAWGSEGVNEYFRKIKIHDTAETKSQKA